MSFCNEFKDEGIVVEDVQSVEIGQSGDLQQRIELENYISPRESSANNEEHHDQQTEKKSALLEKVNLDTFKENDLDSVKNEIDSCSSLYTGGMDIENQETGSSTKTLEKVEGEESMQIEQNIVQITNPKKVETPRRKNRAPKIFKIPKSKWKKFLKNKELQSFKLFKDSYDNLLEDLLKKNKIKGHFSKLTPNFVYKDKLHVEFIFEKTLKSCKTEYIPDPKKDKEENTKLRDKYQLMYELNKSLMEELEAKLKIWNKGCILNLTIGELYRRCFLPQFHSLCQSKIVKGKVKIKIKKGWQCNLAYILNCIEQNDDNSIIQSLAFMEKAYAIGGMCDEEREAIRNKYAEIIITDETIGVNEDLHKEKGRPNESVKMLVFL